MKNKTQLVKETLNKIIRNQKPEGTKYAKPSLKNLGLVDPFANGLNTSGDPYWRGD